MALPGHRRTSGDKRRRASHFALKKVQTTKCTQCKKPILSHHACRYCGMYAGRTVLKIAAPKKKK